jgi:hypothetical protein
LVRTQHLPLPAKTARVLRLLPAHGPSCVVSSSVISGQEMPLNHASYGQIADGIGAEGAVHRTACFRSAGLVSALWRGRSGRSGRPGVTWPGTRGGSRRRGDRPHSPTLGCICRPVCVLSRRSCSATPSRKRAISRAAREKRSNRRGATRYPAQSMAAVNKGIVLTQLLYPRAVSRFMRLTNPA